MWPSYREAERIYKIIRRCPCRGVAVQFAFSLLGDTVYDCLVATCLKLRCRGFLESRQACMPLLPPLRAGSGLWAEQNIDRVSVIANKSYRTAVEVRLLSGDLVDVDIDPRTANVWKVRVVHQKQLVSDPEVLRDAAEALALAAYRGYAVAAEILGQRLPPNAEILEEVKGGVRIEEEEWGTVTVVLRNPRWRAYDTDLDPLVLARL